MAMPWASGVLCLAAAAAVSLGPAPGASDASGTRAVVLGIAQDGGVPHIGCRQDLCVAARSDPARRQRVASLGLVDGDARFLIDATPDLPSQVESLWAGQAPPERRRPLAGILLTHAHVGHYAGLLYLGREALGADHVPVYATPRTARFLRGNAPWSELVARGHVVLHELEPGREHALTPRLRVTPVAVPHRDELSDTVAYVVRGPARSVLYVPDIDKWQRWDRTLADAVAAVDAALLDGTFLDAAEIPGRSQADIPHPLARETGSLLPLALRARVRLIHLNHTNRLLWTAEPLSEPDLRGLAVARDGEELPL